LVQTTAGAAPTNDRRPLRSRFGHKLIAQTRLAGELAFARGALLDFLLVPACQAVASVVLVFTFAQQGRTIRSRFGRVLLVLALLATEIADAHAAGYDLLLMPARHKVPAVVCILPPTNDGCPLRSRFGHELIVRAPVLAPENRRIGGKQ
jgi:hypothetical protein